jgi:rRNA maturation endonuclease Nob1
MRNEEEKAPRCVNEGCRRPADEDSCFCASCGLEWMLLRRDARRDAETLGDRISR